MIVPTSSDARPALASPTPSVAALSARRTVLVLGGLTRLARLYERSSPRHTVVVASTDSRLTARRLGSFDAVVVVPTNLSHQAARRVLEGVRRRGVTVRLAASPGVGTVARAIEAATRTAA